MIPSPFDWLVPLAAAPFVGSFLSVLVVRLPKGEDVVAGRSHCRSCNAKLTPLELIPIVSWTRQGGHCRSCGAGVSALYPVLELGAIAIALWATAVVDGDLILVTAALGWALLALAVMDVRDFILADLLTLPLIPIGLAVAWLLNAETIHWHILGAAFGFGLMVGAGRAYQSLRGREGLGFGDAKLMAAAGAWTGLEGVGTVLLYGALLSLAAVLVARQTGREIGPTTPVPFGAGIAAGFWLTWLYGPLLLGA